MACWVVIGNLHARLRIGATRGVQRCHRNRRPPTRACSSVPAPASAPFKFPVDVKSLSDRERQRLRLYSKSIPLVATHEPLEVIYEDDELLVVHKPDFIKMHPAHRFEGGTLLNRAIAHVGTERHVHVLHRLDMHTTGVVVMGKCPKVARAMHILFRDGGLRKEYLAVVDGQPSEVLQVDAPIQRSAWHKFAREVGHSPQAKPARTTLRLLSQSHAHEHNHALLHCVIHTGRTHQIRVHAAHSGLPIVGDSLYNPAENALYKDMDALQAAAHDKNALRYAYDEPLRAGLKLHAWRISFPDPRNGVMRRFCAPPSGHFDQFCRHARLQIPADDAEIVPS